MTHLTITPLLLHQTASRDSDEVIHVIVYNAIARARTEIMPLPVDSSSRYAVERLDSNLDWRGVDSSLIPNPNYAQTPAAAQFILYFKATEIPPLGAAVFRVVDSEAKIDCPPAVARRMAEQKAGTMPPSRLRTSSKSIDQKLQTEDEIQVSNGALSVTFDRCVTCSVTQRCPLQSIVQNFSNHFVLLNPQIYWSH